MPVALARLDCGCYRAILTDDGVWITYSLDGSEISNVSPKSPRTILHRSMEAGFLPDLTQAAGFFLYCKLQPGHCRLARQHAPTLTETRCPRNPCRGREAKCVPAIFLDRLSCYWYFPLEY